MKLMQNGSIPFTLGRAKVGVVQETLDKFWRYQGFFQNFVKRGAKVLKVLHKGGSKGLTKGNKEGANVLRSYISMICRGRGGQTMAEGGNAPPPQKKPWILTIFEGQKIH